MAVINHLTPPTGQMADNVIGFARALRAAGIPVGPGAIIDAMNALQLIEIGSRADVYATLEAIFVTRHEHALIFAQAFDLHNSNSFPPINKTLPFLRPTSSTITSSSWTL